MLKQVQHDKKNMEISIIVATDERRGIGKDNKIPWYIKEDLVKLKNLTKDHVVILGRKTYDSMLWYYNKSGKQMPGKLYIVITHDKSYKPVRDNAVAVHSLQDAIKKAEAIRHSGDPAQRGTPESLRTLHDKGDSGQARMTMDSNREEVFVIGGGQIFQQALSLADKLYLTVVEGNYNCDTFFPDYSEFKKVVSEESKESEGYKYKFLELEK